MNAVKFIYDLDAMSIDQLCEELRRWAYSYRHYQDNYDAYLLLRVAKLLEEKSNAKNDSK